MEEDLNLVELDEVEREEVGDAFPELPGKKKFGETVVVLKHLHKGSYFHLEMRIIIVKLYFVFLGLLRS